MLTGMEAAMSNTTHTHASVIVSSEIRALMGRHRVTQARLSEVAGISQATMSRRLRADQPFTVDELDAIAAEFDVPVTDLFGLRTGSRRTEQLVLDLRDAVDSPFWHDVDVLHVTAA